MVRGPVTIMKYDPSWAENYVDYAAKIVFELKDFITKIAHIGSTSVEGLGAKPIIDICVTVKDIDESLIIDKMMELGYYYMDKHEKELPFRRYFVLEEDEKHKVHVHIVPDNHPFFNDHLIFRNFLRKHTQIRDEYFLLKTRLSNKYKENRKGYQEAKTEFIEEMTKLAKAELEELE